MNRHTGRKYARCAVVAVIVAATATACTLRPEDLPIPRGATGAGYDIDLDFSSTMSLPSGADVMLAGLRVGEVRDVRLAGNMVDVTAGITRGTRLPADLTAAIRQNTVLGDTYIVLDRDTSRPVPGSLAPGATIPMSRTTSPRQLEDTMAVLSNFIGGGSIQKVEDAIGGIDNVMPSARDVRDIASTVAVDLHDLARNEDVIDGTLAGLNATALSIDDQSAKVTAMMSDEAMPYWKHINSDVLGYIGILLPSIGSIFEGGLWLVPLLRSLADTVTGGRTIWNQAPSTAETLSTFLHTTLLPYLRNPSVDVRSVNDEQGDDLVKDVENLLRMLGATR